MRWIAGQAALPTAGRWEVRRWSGNGLDSSAGKPIGATLGLLIRQKMVKFAY